MTLDKLNAELFHIGVYVDGEEGRYQINCRRTGDALGPRIDIPNLEYLSLGEWINEVDFAFRLHSVQKAEDAGPIIIEQEELRRLSQLGGVVFEFMQGNYESIEVTQHENNSKLVRVKKRRAIDLGG